MTAIKYAKKPSWKLHLYNSKSASKNLLKDWKGWIESDGGIEAFINANGEFHWTPPSELNTAQSSKPPTQ